MIDYERHRVYSKLPVFKRRVNHSLEVIEKAMSIHGPWAVSCSGGKDSVAMLDLCLTTGWHGPLFHFYYDETPSANTRMVRGLAEKHCLDLHILKVPGAFDVYRDVGHFFVHPITEVEKKAVNKMLNGYKKIINQYINAQGWTGQFIGLRKAENRRTRGIMLKKKGYIYQTSNRDTWAACPLANWRTEDVWAYTLSRNLPYLKVYDKADTPEQERSEITWLAAESLWRHGMAARLRIENPKEFYRLADIFPEMRYFV